MKAVARSRLHLLLPPTSFDADLEAIASVPALRGPLLLGLALLLALVGGGRISGLRARST